MTVGRDAVSRAWVTHPRTREALGQPLGVRRRRVRPPTTPLRGGTPRGAPRGAGASRADASGPGALRARPDRAAPAGSGACASRRAIPLAWGEAKRDGQTPAPTKSEVSIALASVVPDLSPVVPAERAAREPGPMTTVP